MRENGPTMWGAEDWLDLAEPLAAKYQELRRAAPLTSSDADQQDALCLVAWDIGAFVEGAIALARGGHWSPALSLGRLIAERAEHLLAIHHDEGFARRFMDATRAITDEGGNTASRRVTDARGAARRFVQGIVDDDGAATGFLDRLIQRSSIGSLLVHPSAVAPALTSQAEPEQTAFVAYQVASYCVWGLFALVLVAERRSPGRADYPGARYVVLAATGHLRKFNTE